jgi:hypothetical protein
MRKLHFHFGSSRFFFSLRKRKVYNLYTALKELSVPHQWRFSMSPCEGLSPAFSLLSWGKEQHERKLTLSWVHRKTQSVISVLTEKCYHFVV